MNDLRKLLVVDGGDRLADDLVSTQLAELGFSSVTASYETAEEVLDMIPAPSAIVLNLPRRFNAATDGRFAAVVRDLKRREAALGIPVIVWDPNDSGSGGLPVVLAATFGPHVLEATEGG